jgi:anti-sigma factor RsiW
VWPGEVVVYDPRAGEIRGHRQLHRLVRQSQSLLAERDARIETVASTRAGERAVVELLAHLAGDGPEVAWPVAVVADPAPCIAAPLSCARSSPGPSARVAVSACSIAR